jgi:hypothetical protein
MPDMPKKCITQRRCVGKQDLQSAHNENKVNERDVVLEEAGMKGAVVSEAGATSDGDDTKIKNVERNSSLRCKRVAIIPNTDPPVDGCIRSCP